MLSWPPSVRVFVATQATDMRCGFDRLAAQVRDLLGQDPLSGHLFVFFGRWGDRVKILFWDRTGFCLYYKRLERGVFHRPAADPHSDHRELPVPELMLILEGLDLSNAKRHPRFSLAGTK
jgi:transposase